MPLFAPGRSFTQKTRRGAVTPPPLFTEDFTAADGTVISSLFGGTKWFQASASGGSATVQGNAARLNTGPSASYGGYTFIWTAVSLGVDDLELTTDITISLTSEQYMKLFFRDDSAGNSYMLVLSPPVNAISWYRMDSNVQTEITAPSGTGVGYTFTNGDVIHLRVRIEGSTMKARVWKNAETEPLSWTATAIPDLTYKNASARKVTIGLGNGSAAVAATMDIDNLKILPI
jgi:hypothetical protein